MRTGDWPTGVRKEDRPSCQRFNYTGIVGSTKSLPRVQSCELYPTFSVQSLFEVWTYEKDSERGERHKGGCAGELVAPTVLPNGQHLHWASSAGRADDSASRGRTSF